MKHCAPIVLPWLAVVLLMGCGMSHGATDPDDAGPADPRPTGRRVGGWLVYTVAEAEGDGFGVGMDPSLTIDGDDRFHLIHVHQDRGDVLYSHGVPGSFETERVGWTDGGARDVRAASHVLAPDGTLHVTYVGERGATHATRSVSGSYSYRPLAFESAPVDSRHPSVGQLADGTLVFIGTGSRSSASAWREIVTIEGSGEPERIGVAQDWRGLNIFVTTTADRHAQVLVRHLGGMLLATRAPSGAWSARTLEPAPLHAGLAATADGVLHAVFVRRDGDGFAVDYGRGPGDGSGFVEERVAIFGHGLSGASIAVGPDGAVHLALDAAGAVHYASNRSGPWLEEEVEVVSSQNGRPVIAVDSRGRPWIAYRNWAPALVLATPAGAP